MNQLLEYLLEDDIFKPVSKEEQKQRESIYIDIRIKEIAEELKKRGKLQSDGAYDFNGDIYINKLDLKSIKELGIKFGKVGGDFCCYRNQLTSLEGIPKEVGESFWCNDNRLTSLEGSPKEVSGSFYCENNQLTSLEGAPEKVGGHFSCYRNQLTSLDGAPEKVGKDFYCYRNQLTSLHGAPKEVGGNFYCHGNQLTSLHGAPKEVGGDFIAINNKKKFTVEEVRAVCKVEGIIRV